MIESFKNLEINGVKVFKLKSFKDNRGSFSETFIKNSSFAEFQIDYVQENESISKKNVFRGMHFQKDSFSQSKLLRVSYGSIIDFLYDLRKSSKSFKKIINYKLNTNEMIFIPKGVAHGFLSLQDDTIINYKCDELYNPEMEYGFNLFKSDIDINPNFKISDFILSDKDKNLPSLNNSFYFE